ncbi:hypothetical protein N9B20_01630 [Mariniblastus sp.]|nr:hypothetical protein [Mariniblastus sp.]
MEFSRGGLHQFDNQHSRGWPRNDAFTQHERQVISADSIFGNTKYDRTASNQLKYPALLFNLTLSSLLVAAMLYCLAKISFEKSTVQFSVTTILIIVTAICMTLVAVLNEQQLYGFVFRDFPTDFPFSPVRTLGTLNWNQRTFVVLGVFCTLMQAMVYFGRFHRSAPVAENAG